MRNSSTMLRFLTVLTLGSTWLLPQTVWAQEGAQAPIVPAASELVESADEINLIEEGRTTTAGRTRMIVITDRFPRRLTGGPHLKMAQDWVVSQFEGYDVNARLEQWGDIEVGFDRGPAKGKIVGEPEQLLTFTTPAWSPGTKGPTRGKAMLEHESITEFKESIEDFTGAWVLRNPAVSRRETRARVKLLTENGALGYISPGSRDGRLITSGSRNVKWDSLPSLPRVTLLYEEFEVMNKAVGDGAEVVLEFDIINQFLHGPIPQYNVILDIKGTQWPDEFVIVQGHLDGWDGAQGACDNGTGVSTTMGAAQMILANGIKPKRTIRFVFYSGEEQGLLGSRGYVEQHVGEMERISIVLNHDNGTNYLEGIQASAAMMEDFAEVFAPIMRLDPERPFKITEVESVRPGPSDHAPFVDAGVPAFHWDQSEEGYRRLHHTQYDNLDQVNDDDQRHSTLVVALSALRFANMDHMVDRSFMRKPSPRLMGVYLGGDDQLSVNRVTPGGRAALAEWEEGDHIVSVNGVAVSNKAELVKELQNGPVEALFMLDRGEEQVESTLSWSDDPLEAERKAWVEREAAAAKD